MTEETVIDAVKLDDLEFDTSLQARAAMDDAAVAEYAEIYREGEVKLPPPVVFYCENVDRYFIGDGWHRTAAARRLKLTEMDMEIRDGGRPAAVEYAVGANRAHGVRRTNADKRRAIEIAIKEWPEHSDRRIAEVCGVHATTVGSVRKQVSNLDTSSRDEKQVSNLDTSNDNENQLRKFRSSQDGGNQVRNFRTSTDTTPEPTVQKRIGRDGKTYPAAAPQKLVTPPEAPAPSTAKPVAPSGDVAKLRAEIQRLKEHFERSERSADLAEREREKSQERANRAVRELQTYQDKVAYLCQLAGAKGSAIEDLELWVMGVRNAKMAG